LGVAGCTRVGDVQERAAASPDGAGRCCGSRREADYLRYYRQSLCFGEARELRVVRFSLEGR